LTGGANGRFRTVADVHPARSAGRFGVLIPLGYAFRQRGCTMLAGALVPSGLADLAGSHIRHGAEPTVRFRQSSLVLAGVEAQRFPFPLLVGLLSLRK